MITDYSATLFRYFLVSCICCRHITFLLWESPLCPDPLPALFLWAQAAGVSRLRGVPCPLSSWVSLVSPPAQGCRAIGWSPGGRCLLLFLDCCTWLLNWGKLRDLPFPQLCNEIVNSSMQGKCFCSACYNAEYGGGGMSVYDLSCLFLQ